MRGYSVSDSVGQMSVIFQRYSVIAQEGGESVGMDENVNKWEGVGHQSMGD